ncbi:flagellar basal body protein [Thalassobacillus sp. C254]|uniref:flagellar basal body protein n=1 Tax=Thalassobacillus sp. C254 TaxID=1225341 RepID=UPI000B0779A0|nr:flagellar basal body protein [Thalassobacillus sp. C254]
MLRGFYGAAAGMITQQRRTEMLTENMANINTPGTKGSCFNSVFSRNDDLCPKYSKYAA